MSEHTPGPWEVRDLILGQFRYITKTDADGIIRDIASVSGDEMGNDQMLVNAHLIAASPNLLKACEYGNTAKEKENVLDHVADLIERDSYGNWEIIRTLREKARMEREAIAKAKGETR